VARWQPNARERLIVAALELFAERGYEDTTVIQIAERAGLTKSTFFRHFPDKREVLFGGATLTTLLTGAIAAAPEDATPLQTVAIALTTTADQAFPLSQRDFASRRHAVIAANPELREREAVKAVGLAAAMVEALEQRAIPQATARVAAGLAMLAFAGAYDDWIEPTSEATFSDLASRQLEALHAAGAALA
jgi:AcrR family transcriptional regulator